MTTVQVDVVAFDLGGVLCDVDVSRAWRVLGLDCEAHFFGGDHHLRCNTGALDGPGFVAECARRAGCQPADVRAAWRAVVRAFPGAAALVARVGVRVVAWSNTDPEHVDALRSALPEALFRDGCALSYEISAMKPEPAFFERALARLGVPAERVVFVDDRADNVAAAAALGVRAARVDGVVDTAAVLARFDVLRRV